MMNEFKRKVVKVVSREGDRGGISGRSFSWSATLTQTAIAECGHEREYRGWCVHVPKTFSPCKECAAGVPWKSVDGPLGFVKDDGPPSALRKVAYALIENEASKASVAR